MMILHFDPRRKVFYESHNGTEIDNCFRYIQLLHPDILKKKLDLLRAGYRQVDYRTFRQDT